MVLSLTPAAVLAVMNRGITSSIVELELVFTMRFLAIMGHPASFKNVEETGCPAEKKTKKPEFKRIQVFVCLHGHESITEHENQSDNQR